MKPSALIFVALDVDTAEAALELARKLHGPGVGFKIGPRLCIRYGQDLMRKLADLGPLFVDCKFLDIPSTMEAAVRAAYDGGASYVTVHAWAGRVALERLSAVEGELNKQRKFIILSVSILTSFDAQSLPPPNNQVEISKQVLDLAKLVVDSGLRGLVTSGHELSAIKSRFPQTYCVVPGVRPPTGEADDQKRVITPSRAVQMGASALVIGRPVIQATDPLAALSAIRLSISEDLTSSDGIH